MIREKKCQKHLKSKQLKGVNESTIEDTLKYVTHLKHGDSFSQDINIQAVFHRNKAG